MKMKGKTVRRLVFICLFFVLVGSHANAELTVDAVYPTLGMVGENLEVTLKGTGFDNNTRLSIYPDTGNSLAIIGSVETTGQARAISVIGDKAYVADYDSGLQVIDISDPKSSIIIGSADTPGLAKAVVAIGDRAYVADWDIGLQVIDISNPSTMEIIGSVDTPGYAEGVACIDNTIYISDGYAGLQVIDIGNPNAPEIIGSVDTPGYAYGIAASGMWAYVADHLEGLQIIDISDPTAPQIIGSVVDGALGLGLAKAVTVVGERAYVADGFSGLQVIDISDPNKARIIGSVNTQGLSNGLTVIGNTAYLATNDYGLRIIDISDPTAPRMIGSVDTPGNAYGISVLGQRAFVADQASGIQIIDISNPNEPSGTIKSIDTPGFAYGINVIGDRAYVADWSSGLQVIDVGNPGEPGNIVGSVDTPGYAYGVTVVGETAYVADDTHGLQVIDISEPTAPEMIASIDTPGEARDVTVVEKIAYVVDGESGLQVIDTSNRLSPELIASVDTPELVANGVAIVGDRAYVAGADMGLMVIDIRNPRAPEISSWLDTPGQALGVSTVGETAYVADGSSGLQVVDISNPSEPEIIGSVELKGGAQKITINGQWAYVVSDYDHILHVIDISSNPQEPKIIGSMDMPDYPMGVAVCGDYAHVTCSASGMAVFPVPVEVFSDSMNVTGDTEISLTLPIQSSAGNFILKVFNATENDELMGAVSFTAEAEMLDSKAVIVAGGGPNAPGNIWDVIKYSANKAYNVLLHEGFDDDHILYLADEYDNEYVDHAPRYETLKWAVDTWAQDASELIVFLVDHGLPDEFILHSNGDYIEKLNVSELDGWLDDLQVTMIGPVTFIYDACHSGTFATKMRPPEGKHRIVITGSSNEFAYFLGEATKDTYDSFSIQFWDQLHLRGGNFGKAFSGAAEIMKGYNQTALINSNANNNSNEEEDYSIANNVVARRAKKIFLKPSPYIEEKYSEITLEENSSGTIRVRNVREADRVWASIIPPHIEISENGNPITSWDTVELSDSDNDGIYEGRYDGFTMEGSYIAVIYAQSSQEIFDYLQNSMSTHSICSKPVYASALQTSGTQKINTDGYEQDDSYLQANVITLDDADVQPHNIHDSGDVDWVKFFGLSGQTYTISLRNPNKICDAIVELYTSDGTPLLDGSDNISTDAVGNKYLRWQCPQDGDGIYCVKISNANFHFGENVKYNLKIYRPIGPSLSALISGRVMDANHVPISNVRIFTDSGASAISDGNGTFFIRHQAGVCTVTLISDQHGSTTLQIDVKEGQENHHDLILDGGSGTSTPANSSGGGGGGGCFILHLR